MRHRGGWINDDNTLTFAAGQPATRTVTVYGHRPRDVAWKVARGAGGVSLSASAGTLSAADGYEQRLTVSYDGRGRAARST